MKNMAILSQDTNMIKKMGARGKAYLLDNYTVDKVATQITRER